MLTKIQLQERAKRKRNRLNMMGLRQPKGTQPHISPKGTPVFNPIPIRHPVTDMRGLVAGVNAFLAMMLLRRQRRAVTNLGR